MSTPTMATNPHNPHIRTAHMILEREGLSSLSPFTRAPGTCAVCADS
jgi:hypothetical protein